MNTTGAMASTCNIDTIIKGAQTKKTSNTCSQAGFSNNSGTITAGTNANANTCISACDTDYAALFPAGITNANKVSLLKGVIPVVQAISALALSPTDLANMQVCCFVYNGNQGCGL